MESPEGIAIFFVTALGISVAITSGSSCYIIAALATIFVVWDYVGEPWMLKRRKPRR